MLKALYAILKVDFSVVANCVRIFTRKISFIATIMTQSNIWITNPFDEYVSAWFSIHFNITVINCGVRNINAGPPALQLCIYMLCICICICTIYIYILVLVLVLVLDIYLHLPQYTNITYNYY